MVESKKPAAKQVSIAAFFSPKTAAKPPASPPRAAAAAGSSSRHESPAPINADAFATPSPHVPHGKRKRASGTRSAKKKLVTASDEDENEHEAVVDLTASTEKPTKRTKTAKPRAAATARAKPTKKAPVVRRGVSPHEAGGDDDDDDDESEEDVVRAEPTPLVPASASVVETINVDDSAEEEDEKLDEETTKQQPTPTKPKARATKKAAATALASPAPKAKRASAKKDKDTTGSGTTTPAAGSPQKPPPAPVDPVVCARIATYQQRIDELTQLCDRLTYSKAQDDEVLLEIYGVGLDVDLDPANDEQRTDIHEAWRALNEATTATTGTTELPAALKHFVARMIQSRSDSLTALVKRISTALSNVASVTAASTLTLEMEIKMLAQRTSYGARPTKANLYEDTTPEAMWCWEVNNIELHFSEEAQKVIKRVRKQRKRTGTQLKSLSRVLQLLHQSPIDEAKVANEEAKIGKFVSQVESELLKAREREKRDEEKTRKEQEKAHALEEKKRLEHEKQLAKEEEKRKKEEEAEAERQLAERRRKSMVSYFRSIDTVSDAVSSTGSTTDTEKTEKMACMDREVSYLVKNSSSSPASKSGPTPNSRSGPALLQRQRDLVTARSGHWNCRRYRDQKLGIMKLLQFHENHRPAYFGTFSKRSVVFRRGRRPLAQYAKFDYTVDSEEEWEEEEPGESLSDADSDMDGDDDEDQLDYGDDWLAYEDEVEYVDGEELRDDDDVVMDEDGDGIDGDDENGASQDVAASRKRRRRRVAAENKKQKLTKLVPQLSGPFVCCEADCDEHLNRYNGELLDESVSFVSPLMKKAQAREDAAAAAAAAVAAPTNCEDGDTGTGASTPAAKKKKIKTAKPQTTTTPETTSALTTSVKTTHKPPVKRKISPQLLSATSTPDTQEATDPRTPSKVPTFTSTTTGKKNSEKTTTNGTTAAQPRTSPVKSGITGWLKTPTSVSAKADAASSATTSSSAAKKAPVEI